MTTNKEFLPEGYESPKGGSNYMKLEKGDNKFRILFKPAIGWMYWDDKTPRRFKMNEKPDRSDLRHFWALIVWNYKTKEVNVLELTQKGILKDITVYVNNPDWGAPYAYDININRTGDGISDTKYTVMPSPHKELSEEIKSALADIKIDLDKIYTNEDPFVNA